MQQEMLTLTKKHLERSIREDDLFEFLTKLERAKRDCAARLIHSSLLINFCATDLLCTSVRHKKDILFFCLLTESFTHCERVLDETLRHGSYFALDALFQCLTGRVRNRNLDVQFDISSMFQTLFSRENLLQDADIMRKIRLIANPWNHLSFLQTYWYSYPQTHFDIRRSVIWGVLWPKFRRFVQHRMILNYWIDATARKTCAVGGCMRQRHADEFYADMSSPLMKSNLKNIFSSLNKENVAGVHISKGDYYSFFVKE